MDELATARLRGHRMHQKAIELALPNDATCVILKENLDEYRKLTLQQAQKLTNSYQEIWNSLTKESVQVDKWKSSLQDPSHYIKNLPCLGKFEACKSYEVKESHLIDLRVDAKKIAEKNIQKEQDLHQHNDIIPSSQSTSSFGTASKISTPWNQSCSNTFSMNNEKYQLTNNYHGNDFNDFQSNSNKYFANNSNNSRPVPIKPCKRNFTSPAITKAKSPPPSTSFVNDSEFKTDFRTALQEHNVQIMQKRKLPQTSTSHQDNNSSLMQYGAGKKSLGGRRITGKFVPPLLNQPNQQQELLKSSQESVEEVDERLKNIDPNMIELIKNEIMNNSTPIAWDDIAGLKYAKTIIQEAVVLPILRPDIFTGLRRPPRGILLFGPPGTGKTLLGKCIASQSRSTFFSISASSLTSKWIGEGEKMVRTLFAVAAVHQPAVIFIDEIDSLLCQRSETEHESSRRLKTEFLVQLDGVGTGEDDRILIVGATNRPQELDEAARRRLVKRLYIPLPEHEARVQILQNLIKYERHSLNGQDILNIGDMTEGYSGADIKTLCHEASMGPIRSISFELMANIDRNDVRPLNINDFMQALKRVRTSVAPSDLVQYVNWDKTYGSGGMAFE